jgi:hypothetical protein
VNEILITCPKCAAAEPIKIVWSNGTPDVFYMPNGDPGYPGDPGGIEEIVADCACWPEEVYDDAQAMQFLDNIIGAWSAFQIEAEARDMEQLYRDEEAAEASIVINPVTGWAQDAPRDEDAS